MVRICWMLLGLLGAALTAGGQGDGRQCADQNGDGVVTAADFNGWILNFNAGSFLADVNRDGLVTAADFNAWIQAFNAGATGPTCDAELFNAARVVAAIETDGDVDIYRLFAEIGDNLLVAAGEEEDGGFAVRATLVSPGGVELDARGSNHGFKLESESAPETGYYSIVVTGTPDRTGVYALTAVRIGTVLPAGLVLMPGIQEGGDIVFGDIDVYRISVPAGATLSVTVSESVSQFSAELRLYDPLGVLIDRRSPNGGVTIDAPPAPGGGTYVAMVSSSGGDTQGAYTISATVTP